MRAGKRQKKVRRKSSKDRRIRSPESGKHEKVDEIMRVWIEK